MKASKPVRLAPTRTTARNWHRGSDRYAVTVEGPGERREVLDVFVELDRGPGPRSSEARALSYARDVFPDAVTISARKVP